MPVQILNAIAQSSAERLVNSALEGIVLALLAWLVLGLFPRQNAGTRFSIWMAVLLSIAVLPLAEALARIERPAAAAIGNPPLTIPASWGTALFVVWATIASVLLARVVAGVLQLRKLRNAAEEVNPVSLDALSRQTLLDFQQHRAVKLCVSNSVSVPTAVGLFRPAVVVPRWALSELAADDLNAVLVHELAHLKRRDDWTNLVQKLVRAVFFFHPAVWWIENRLSLEREMACDEHVLATTANPRGYAECLVSLAERGFLHRAVMMAQGAVSRVRECSARVAQILNGGRPRTAQASRLALISAASGSILMLATFAQAPNLVAFGRPAPSAQAASSAALAGGHGSLARRSETNQAKLTLAAWHPQSQAVARATPAAYAGSQQSNSAKAPAISRPAVQRRYAQRQAAPLLHRASFQQHASDSAAPQLVLVQQTTYFTDGQQVWAVSIYRVAVLQAQPAAAPDFSRRAI
jgi:beta-lactamase regulating signal transducer with metallopeptidase domain